MDYSELKEVTLGEAATVLISEGAGVAGGFVGGAFVGRQVQNWVKPDDQIKTLTDGIIAWAANNIPKIGIWYLGGRYVSPLPKTSTEIMASDARKALAGSVAFDTLMRIAHGGKNPATAYLGGWQVLGSGDTRIMTTAQSDIQRLIQENSALRNQLNNALRKLASGPQLKVMPPVIPPIQVTPIMPPIQVSQPPEVAERQRRFGAMEPEPPLIAERERRYGFMSEAQKAKLGFQAGEENIASKFGML